MATESKTANFEFSLAGIVSKENPSLLKDGQYRSALNVTANQEGALASRNGVQQVGSIPGTYPTCYQIRKMVVVPGENPQIPITNPRYLGVLDASGGRDILRTTNYQTVTEVATGVDPAVVAGATVPNPHWEMADYAAAETGSDWAYFACPNAMLKDSGNDPFTALQPWGVLPAAGVVCAKAGSSGNLNGGTNASPNNSQPYDWIATYLESFTNDQGNPSQPMQTASTANAGGANTAYIAAPLALINQSADLVVWGSGVSNVGYINVYRRGGILTDGIYRLVATVPNPGGAEAPILITDNIADADLVYTAQAEFDNDPPVTSTLPSTLNGVFVGPGTPQGWGSAIIGALATSLTPGTLVNINDPAGSESVVIEATSPDSFRAFFLYAHAAGVVFQVNAITNQPCHLTMVTQDDVLVAGDPNNPHILYKSKSGGPQQFPVGTDAAGNVTNIGVGTPSNGIVNFCEYRGQVLCMNVSSLYETAIINGSLVTPAKVADKGLAAQSAWCQTANEVWFLVLGDGVYSWDGATLRNRTQAIDPIFHEQSYNGLYPISWSPLSLYSARMAYRRGSIHLLYTDITGAIQEIVCEPGYGDRWVSYTEAQATIYPPFFLPITEIFTEPDTNSLIVACNGGSGGGATFGIADSVLVATNVNPVLTPNVNFTADWYTVNPDANAFVISWDIRLPWFDMGMPQAMKLYEEVFLDADPQVYNGVYVGALVAQSYIYVELLLNYSDTPVDTFPIQVPGAPGATSMFGRQLISLLPNLTNVSGNTWQSYGREARAISFHIYGTAYPIPQTLYRLLFKYQETGDLTTGASQDWIDLGAKTDKRFYQMAVIFDTAGINQQIAFETLGGPGGITLNALTGSPQVFTLSNPVILGSNRCLIVFPMADETVAKLIRVRPYTAATVNIQSPPVFFRILDVTFPYMEVYPADVVTTIEWEDGGYEYDKYLNQVDLEVNTNNVPVVFQMQADGANMGEPLTVQTNLTDRRVNLTMPTGLVGKKWRWFCNPTQAAIATGGGMFQVFSHRFAFQKADPGEVMHTFDWDELGWPWDKYLRVATLQWDLTGDGSVTMQMDTLGGIDGNVITSNVAQFVLAGGRSQCAFPLPVDLIAKRIRIYPLGTPAVTFKNWQYRIDHDNYPADIILSSDWKMAQSPDDKNPSWLYLDADTAGTPATVILENENGAAMTVTHTGTVDDRMKNYPIPPDIYAKMWRILPTPGMGGKYQSFNWNFARWHSFEDGGPEDPPNTVLWTPWNDLGWAYGKTARNLIMKIDTGGIQAIVQAQADGLNMGPPFLVTTTYTNRSVILPFPVSNLNGVLWRLLITPGTNGYAKLWTWGIEKVNLPPAVSYFDSYPQGFGYPFWKFIKQIWLTYSCAGGVTFTITSDTGTYSVTLPAQQYRATQRFYLPTVWGAGLNKSKLYDVVIASVVPGDPYMVYADSVIEWLPMGADRHGAYQKQSISELMQLPSV